MEMSFEVLFILTLLLPPLTIAALVCALIGSSFITMRTHAEQQPVAGAVAARQSVGH
jgi:hypothetical protein